MKVRLLAVLIVGLALSGATALPANVQVASVPGDPLKGSGKVARVLLTYSDLFSTAKPATPLNEGVFALPANAAPPTHFFEGRLELGSSERNGTFEKLRDDFNYLGTRKDVDWDQLPKFSFEFVQNGSHFIPVRQALVITGHPAWNYIIGPGRVWQEDGDHGYSRASFPFTLVQRNQNCTHNGVMSLLFTDGKRKNISNVRYQITQETCLYFKFNMWGQVSATYTPYRVKDSERVKNEHAAEVSNRLPTKSFSELATDYPTSRINLGGFIQAFRAPEHITLYGLLINGVNYVSGCPTRFGEYPFCENLRLPSYSTAKSAFASVVMMRLGALYGPGVYQELIRDYLPEHANGGDWSHVTFANTLDMATGNYVSSDYLADENGDNEGVFLTNEAYAKKIAAAFALFPHKAEPSTIWVYQSHATFIVTQAMNAYLERRRGPTADIFELLRDDVFKPIKFSQGSLSTLRTDNTDKITAKTGKAFGSHGLFYIYDDVAKLSKFLNNDGGRIGDVQILDPVRLRDSLFRNPDHLGLAVSGPSGILPGMHRYQSAFWGTKMTQAQFPGDYGCEFWVARMGGYGGISIVLMPNGISYYVFSDNDEFPWYDAVREANKLAPFCKE
jgi:hypothetical protein